MHLFSGQSSQPTSVNGPSRSFSPAPPRRSIQLGPSTLPRRPGLNQRTSSLSAASLASSTESLPATARIPNGSSLKKELASSQAQDGPDPRKVLEDILGPLRGRETADGRNNVAKPDTLHEDIDFQGLSLEEFADGELQSTVSNQSKGVRETPAVEDFEKEKDKFEDLHKSILACDEVLNSVETYLTSFQADLANVSAEIETLQNRSTALNNRVQNRKAVERVLGPEVEGLVIPPTVVRKISEGNVDEAWVKALEELDRRSKSIDAKLKEGRDIKALQDVRPFIDDLSAKAVERIRDYVVTQIKALRSPNINAQLIQQNNLLRYKDVFAFLAKRQPQLSEEIAQAYINTMRWYYSSHFARYKAAIDKLSVSAPDPNNTFAADNATSKTVKGGGQDLYSIGRRTDILRTSNNVGMPAYAAEEDKGTHHLEVPFRALNMVLVDNASAEYSFLTEFFSKQPHQSTNRRFNEVFQQTFDLGHALTKQLTENTFDALGVLTCVRINQHLAFELQRRKVPAVEGYINGTNMLLWPRFQKIIDAHCESIRKATAALSGKPTGSALSLTSASASQTTAPHPLTQRYANFVQGILALSSEAGDDEPVSNSVGRLRNDFEAFLAKLSKSIAEARKRDRFLYNNYSLICTIIAETEGKLADEMKRTYLEKRDALGTS